MDALIQKVEELYEAALELPDAAGRKALLDHACQGAPELRARLDKLLAVPDHAETFSRIAAPR